MKSRKLSPSLGILEGEIMEIIWQLKSATVRDVLNKLQKKKKVAYTTVMTVMSRLYTKGILKRRLDENGAYVYSPKLCKESYFATTSKEVISSLIKEFGEVAVSQFIDVIESSNLKDLEAWKKKLKKIK